MEYTFRSHNGQTVTVSADDEIEARDEAMRTLWGDDSHIADRQGNTIMCRPYVGLGLSLIDSQ